MPRHKEPTTSPRRSHPAAAAVLIPPRSVGHDGKGAPGADDFADLAAVARRDNAVPWADKLPRAVWRGSPTGAARGWSLGGMGCQGCRACAGEGISQ